MHVPLLLAGLALLSTGCQSVHRDDGPGEGDATLTHKVEQMDLLLLEQQRLFRQLNDRLSHQDTLLRQLNDRVFQQETVIHDQGSKLSAQDTSQRQLSDRVSHQETVIRDQDISLRQLNDRLSQQDTVIRDQGTKLSAQDTSLRQLYSEKSSCLSQLRRFENKLNSLHMTQNMQGDVTTDDSNAQQSKQSTRQWTSSDATNVMTRSDDTDPLEAVVSQLSQQVTEMGADITTLKTSDSRQDQDLQDAATSTFTRWGSSQCPDASQLVYSGVVGGSLFSDTGAATNYLCLTMTPVPATSFPGGGAFLYGAEYQTTGSHYNEDSVCSVCRSNHSTTIMIPGTNVCTTGWQRQYSGYLMAGYSTHVAGSEYICVDTSLDSRPGSSDNHDGKLLYGVQAHCGSLPCGPYVADAGVTCAVCSK